MEYVIKLGDQDAASTVIVADKSDQYAPEEWSMRHRDHARTGGTPNVQTGDGHVESRRRSELFPHLYRPLYPWNEQVGW